MANPRTQYRCIKYNRRGLNLSFEQQWVKSSRRRSPSASRSQYSSQEHCVVALKSNLSPHQILCSVIHGGKLPYKPPQKAHQTKVGSTKIDWTKLPGADPGNTGYPQVSDSSRDCTRTQHCRCIRFPHNQQLIRLFFFAISNMYICHHVSVESLSISSWSMYSPYQSRVHRSLEFLHDITRRLPIC